MGTLDGKVALVTGSGRALLDAAQGPGLPHQEDLVVAYREDSAAHTCGYMETRSSMPKVRRDRCSRR